jgi:hypothetical protein
MRTPWCHEGFLLVINSFLKLRIKALMKQNTGVTKFKGVLTKENNREVYKLCNVSIEHGTITLSILETSIQCAQQN